MMASACSFLRIEELAQPALASLLHSGAVQNL